MNLTLIDLELDRTGFELGIECDVDVEIEFEMDSALDFCIGIEIALKVNRTELRFY